MSVPDTNGWSRAEMFVLAELERLSGEVAGMREDITNVRLDGAKKGGLWGAFSGAVVAVIGALFR